MLHKTVYITQGEEGHNTEYIYQILDFELVKCAYFMRWLTEHDYSRQIMLFGYLKNKFMIPKDFITKGGKLNFSILNIKD